MKAWSWQHPDFFCSWFLFYGLVPRFVAVLVPAKISSGLVSLVDGKNEAWMAYDVGVTVPGVAVRDQAHCEGDISAMIFGIMLRASAAPTLTDSIWPENNVVIGTDVDGDPKMLGHHRKPGRRDDGRERRSSGDSGVMREAPYAGIPPTGRVLGQSRMCSSHELPRNVLEQISGVASSECSGLVPCVPAEEYNPFPKQQQLEQRDVEAVQPCVPAEDYNPISRRDAVCRKWCRDVDASFWESAGALLTQM